MKDLRLQIAFWISFVLLIASGCQSGEVDAEGNKKPSTSQKAKSTGSHAELLIVIDDAKWSGPVGEALRRIFTVENPGLPQPESMFNVIQVNPSSVTSLLKKTKSVVIIEPGDTSFFEKRDNVWAQPQLVAIFSGSDFDIVRQLKAEGKALAKDFRSRDLQLIANRQRSAAYKILPKEITKFGITGLALPTNFQVTTVTDSVAVLWSRGVKTDQGLLVYKRPLRDEILPGQDIIAVRDSICKHFVPGAVEGSYMATEMRYAPQQEVIEIDGAFAILTRGLWRSEGDKMGGPFISYTIYLDNTNEILTLDGWFYGPGVKKRNFMMEMEAFLSTLKLR